SVSSNSVWSSYARGGALLEALSEGRSPRAVWSALPGQDWPEFVAAAVAATYASGRGAVVVVPDARDVVRVDEALVAVLGAGRHLVLTADLGPRERYRRWLDLLRGHRRIVVGTRAAAFAPVSNLGLAVIWDDGDDLHSEPRAPYPHVREVLALRAHLHGVALIVGGYARTAEGASMVETGFAASLEPARDALKQRAPRVRATDDGSSDDPVVRTARLPPLAWRTAKHALQSGPVLVQVPRSGYVPAVACTRCRTRGQCSVCRGPLSFSRAGTQPTCRWCGAVAASWQCQECGNDRLQGLAVGARRTAEELGQAFPGVKVLTSSGDKIIDRVASQPALVIATPGAEPLTDDGYAAALLLDTWALLGRLDLRANEETLRRWMTAASLVRPAETGGQVVVVADSSLRPVQALVRWDSVGHAARELQDRAEVGLPPATRVAVLTGIPAAIEDLLRRTSLPGSAVVLGPTAFASSARPDQVRTLIRVPRTAGLALAHALHQASGERSARKEPDTVNIRIDPQELG
ncbi:MAG TPA: primosome assembly protein PriA, partial [Actinomycetes bacterium]|nr:primosome assembly protein PriA [Actinomycetes bacterium]